MVNKTALMGKIVAEGYTQATLAPLIGISKNTLNASINNKRPFDTDEVIAMCKILAITSDAEKIDIFLHESSHYRDNTSDRKAV